MLSPRLRRQVFELWKMFWSSGMTNPLTAIEQITYLLFIKRLESLDAERISKGKRSIYGQRSKCQLQHHPEDGVGVDKIAMDYTTMAQYGNCPGHGTCRWSYITRYSKVIDSSKREITTHDLLSQYVFPWLRELESTLQDAGNSANGIDAAESRLRDAHFQLPPEKTSTLQNAIRTIDDLFRQVGTRSANYDIMGDIFEYLLSEIETSGKNGQFRTPRHIIRFMIELLDPKPGQRIIDPAAGTCGFLINSILHIKKKQTDPETVLLEWDGTPHRVYGGDPSIEPYLTGEYFTGYDNDRTMVRIGWMNMILHGIESPSVMLRDSLDKNNKYEGDSGAYDLVMANPPFTGTVDKDDLHELRFPRNPRNAKEPITNKSELLFIWLMLDLLKVGGRAAVIVPEGVLFGSTGAHRELRRQLLFEHRLEGVISLPAGVFQPYTGVKTSILVFQKIGGELAQGEMPRTESVWFYEVAADGYTLDAKRNDKPEPNDLWDALEKWPDKVIDNTDYHQPQLYDVRWRVVDDAVIKLFSRLAHERDNVLGIHEMFTELPSDPQEATAKIVELQSAALAGLYEKFYEAFAPEDWGENFSLKRITNAPNLDRMFRDSMRQQLESDFDEFGIKALRPLLDNAKTQAASNRRGAVSTESSPYADYAPEYWQGLVDDIVIQFAKLDGYNVKLRTLDVSKQTETLGESKSWAAPVRVFAKRDDWQSADEKVRGSHDEAGQVRAEYLADGEIYNKDGTVRAEYLEQGCIEANDLNLSAGRYKPFTLAAVEHEPPAHIIRALQELEGRIQEGLGKLLSMVEDK